MTSLKCGCVYRIYPDNEDGPAEEFWDYCAKCQKRVDETGWERRKP